VEKEEATACCCRQEPSRRLGDVNTEESLLAASIIMILSTSIDLTSTYHCISIIAFEAHPTHQNFLAEEEVMLRTAGVPITIASSLSSTFTGTEIFLLSSRFPRFQF